MFALLKSSGCCAGFCFVVVEEDWWTVPRLQGILNPNIHGKRSFFLTLF